MTILRSVMFWKDISRKRFRELCRRAGSRRLAAGRKIAADPHLLLLLAANCLLPATHDHPSFAIGVVDRGCDVLEGQAPGDQEPEGSNRSWAQCFDCGSGGAGRASAVDHRD